MVPNFTQVTLVMDSSRLEYAGPVDFPADFNNNMMFKHEPFEDVEKSKSEYYGKFTILYAEPPDDVTDNAFQDNVNYGQNLFYICHNSTHS